MEQPLTLAPEPGSARSRRRREPESPPAPIPLFGAKTIVQRSPDEPALSKAEFVEKVRQSNQACHDGDFHTAIVLYNEALAVDPQNCILYSNRSAAYMKTQQYHKALDDAIKARLLNPKWPKQGFFPSHFGEHWRLLQEELVEVSACCQNFVGSALELENTTFPGSLVFCSEGSLLTSYSVVSEWQLCDSEITVAAMMCYIRISRPPRVFFLAQFVQS